MNQLTIKVISFLMFRLKVPSDWNFLLSENFIFITGAQETGPVHRVLLFQHPEAGGQPPAEVFLDFLLKAAAPEMPPFHPFPLFLSPQRLWGSVVSPQWSEGHVPVEAEIWASRSGCCCYRRSCASNPHDELKQNLSCLNINIYFVFGGGFIGFQLPSQPWVLSL